MNYYIYKPESNLFPPQGVTHLGFVDGLVVASVDSVGEEFLKQNYNIRQITEDEANNIDFYGEVRGYAKIWTEPDDIDPYKQKIDITPEIEDLVVSLMKKVCIKNLEIIFNGRYQKIGNEGSSLEVYSWEQQKTEAIAYKADSTAQTTILSILAEAHNISVAELADKVLIKVNEYNIQLAETLASQQLLVKQVESLNTIRELNVWREEKMGIQMPVQQAIDEGLTDSETNNRFINPPIGIQF